MPPNSQSPSLISGIIHSLFSVILSRLGAVVASFAIIKLLSIEELGLFLGVQTIILMGGGFCNLGLVEAYRSIASRNPYIFKRLLATTLAIQCCANILYLVLVLLYLHYTQRLFQATVFIAIGALLMQLPDIIYAHFCIKRKFKYIGMFNTLSLLSSVLAAIMAYCSNDKLYGACLGYLIGAIAFLLIVASRLDRQHLNLSFSKINVIQLKLARPFFASLVVTRMGLYASSFLALTFLGSVDTALIGFSIKLYQLALLVAISITSMVVPHLHALMSERNQKELSHFLSKFSGALWCLLGSIPIIFFNFTEELILLFSSAEYLPAKIYIQILGVSALFKALSLPAGDLLEAKKKQWLRLIVQIISSCIIIIPSLLLLKHWGAIITMYSMLCADMTSFILLWGIHLYYLENSLYIQHVKAILIIFSILALFSLIGHSYLIFIPLMALYFLLFNTSKVFTLEDIKQLETKRNYHVD